MPIIFKTKTKKLPRRIELENFLTRQKENLLAQVGAFATVYFRECRLILPTEDACDVHIYNLFPSVDYEETIENNQADILADFEGHLTAFRKPMLL